MSTKRETLLIGLLCLFATSPAFAESDWLIAQTDKTQYHTGEDMEILGFVFDVGMPEIAVQIYDPDGEILGAYGVELESDNGFSKIVSLDSPFYDKSGLYVINFDYGQESDELFFEVVGAAPEEPQEEPIPLVPEVLIVTTDKTSYSDNEFITISGLVSNIGDPTILVGIYDPNDFPAGFYTPQINSDLEFTVSFLAKDGVNFKIPGTYSVKAHYGQSKQTTSFSFVENQVQAPENTPIQDPSETQNDNDSTVTPQIVLNPTPKEEPKQEQKDPKPENKPQEVKPIIQNIPKSSAKEDTPKANKPDEVLSEQEIEIGGILNEITLGCDNSHYTDSIVYGEGMGPALMRLCNYEQAVSYFDKSLVKDPNNPEILTNKGAALGKQGHFDLALEHYNLALKMDPNFIPALNNKANALAETGKLEQALTIYNEILDQDPSYTIARSNLENVKEEIIQIAKMQEEKQPVISVNLDNSIPKAETPQIIYESKEPTNVIEQIGSFFAGIFGFLK